MIYIGYLIQTQDCGLKYGYTSSFTTSSELIWKQESTLYIGMLTTSQLLGSLALA